MHNKFLQAVIILAATAVVPMGLLAFNIIGGGEPEGLKMLPLFLIAHGLVWLPAIQAFRKAPALSWALWTLLYPLGMAAALALVMSPMGNPIEFLWFMGMMVIAYWWVIISVGGVCSTIVFILTRSQTEPPDRDPVAPIP